MKTFAVYIHLVGDAVPSEYFPSLNSGYDNVKKGIFLIDAESMDDLFENFPVNDNVRSMLVHGEIENIQEYRNEFPPVLASPGDSVTVKELDYIKNITSIATETLQAAAQRVKGDKGFAAYRLEQYRRDADLTDEALSEFLGCKSMDTYYLVCFSLIQPPRTPFYSTCLDAIVYSTGCDRQALDEVLKYAFEKYT